MSQALVFVHVIKLPQMRLVGDCAYKRDPDSGAKEMFFKNHINSEKKTDFEGLPAQPNKWLGCE